MFSGKQSLLSQFLTGAAGGIVLTMLNIVSQPQLEPLLSGYTLGLFLGGALVGGSVYMLFCWFFASKK